MNSYSGNPSLSTAVKDRVSSTFAQSVSLYKQGRADEVVAGCNLILQMDPMFDPAKKLLEKVRNPAAPIDVDALLPTGGSDALEEARAAMLARDFQRAINITTDVLTNDLMNDEARVLGDEARAKLEAGPFIDQFARKCEQHLAAGNPAAARSDLEKARTLDPDHPTIALMDKMINGGGSSAGAGGFSVEAPPSFVVDAPQPSPASGRGTAQATDFGFTFEEEKPPPPADPGSFAFSSAPESGDFSFGAPSTGGFSFEAPADQPPPAPEFGFGSSGAGGFSFDDTVPSAPQAPAAPPAPTSGFSFDAPPTAGGFSFGAPAAPAEGSFGSSEFDFASIAGGVTSPDDQQKIDAYLTEGDRLFAAGEYQQAIDLWSRIFLIDVTNEQASERIERAKGKHREIEQKVDDLLAGGVHAFNRKDFDAARPRFAEVLKIDPDNATALDYVQRLSEAAASPSSSPSAPRAAAAPAPLSEMRDQFNILEEEEDAAAGIPEPAAPKAEKKEKARPGAASKGFPRWAIAAALALVVIAGGWFAWSKFSAADDTATTSTLLAQATKLAQTGHYDEAIAMLQDVKAEDPLHDRAVSLMADFQHKQSQASERIAGRPAAAFFQEQVTAGRAAIDVHDYDGAKKAFEQAMRIKPLPPDLKALYDTAAQQVAKLDSAKALFKERRYQDAIESLGGLLQQDPQNRNIQRMIIDAHFNLGATALQEERTADALAEFDQVLKADTADELAKRSKELAARYNGQPKDLLYKIYVKYLPLRQVV